MSTETVPKGYKRTEVGVIPEDWEVKTLREIGSFDKGRGVLKEDITEGGVIPAIPYTALYTDFGEVLDSAKIDNFINDSAKSLVISDPCVLIASSSNMTINTGKATAKMDSSPVAIGREVIIFKTASNSAYISYQLGTDQYRKRTLSISRGTTIKHLYPATFFPYLIALPSPTEQQAIVAALSDADALIESLESLLDKKRQIKKGAMQELLTGKRRLPGFTDNWETKQLGDVATFFKGKGLPKSALTESGAEPCIHYGELFTRYPETIGEIFSRTDNAVDIFRSVANDVLMPTSDVTPKGLAKASCIRVDGVILGGDILVIRSDTKLVHGSFLSLVIRFEEKQVLQLVTGSTVFHLYGSDMKNFIFSVPPLPEQTAIAAVLSDMDSELEALEAKLDKARQIKQGMMQLLLTGKVRLV